MGELAINALATITVKELVVALAIVVMGLTKARDPSNPLFALGLGWFAFTAICIFVFMSYGITTRFKKKNFVVFMFFLVLCCFGFLISLSSTFDLVLSIGSALKFFLFFLSIFFLAVILSSQEANLLRMRTGFELALIFLSSYTLMSVFFDLPVADDSKFIDLSSDFYASGRLPTIFGEPSYFGFSTLILSIGIFKSRKRGDERFGKAAIFLSLPALLVAGSLLCILTAFINLLLLINWREGVLQGLLRRGGIQLVSVAPLLIVVAFFFVYVSFDFAFGRALSIIANEDGSALKRFNALHWFFSSLGQPDSFIGGIGFVQFEDSMDLAGIYTGGVNVIIATGGVPLLFIYLLVFFRAIGFSGLSLSLLLFTLFAQGEPFYPLLSLCLGLCGSSSVYDEKTYSHLCLSANRHS